MNRELSKAITRDRLLRWGALLAERIATPVLLLGICHGPFTGEVKLVVTEDMTTDEIEGFLLFALTQLCPQKYKVVKNDPNEGGPP